VEDDRPVSGPGIDGGVAFVDDGVGEAILEGQREGLMEWLSG